MATRELDPISRIEGHLGAKLTTSGTAPNEVVDDVQVHGNLWRGFENFLIGREPNDAITFTQRICGVCPVPHGTTATHATEAAIGYSGTIQFQTPDMDANTVAGTGVPPKALHVRNLVLGAEFLMSSLTHFYHLAAPSYVQGPAVPPWTPYFDNSYYVPQLQSAGKGTGGLVPAPYATNGILPAEHAKGFSTDLWSAVIKQYVKALRIRRLTFEAGAMFAGRMPMTSANVAGGVTTLKSENLSAKCTKFRSFMVEIGNFVVQEYVPLVLALGALYKDYDNLANGGKGWGGGCGNFLSWGGFPKVGGAADAFGGSGQNHFTRGFIVNANSPASTVSNTINAAAVAANLTEHITSSKYEYNTARATAANIPTTGITLPTSVQRTIPDRENGYSYLKAPRWNGNPMEVGPLASMVVDGWYPVSSTGTYLRSQANLGAYYSTYVKTVNGPFVDVPVTFAGAGTPVAIVPGAVVSATVTNVDNAVGAGVAYASPADYTDNGNGTITWNNVGSTFPLTVYVDFTGSVSGLDPAMVAPDLAVALARSSAAKLFVRTGTGAVAVADGAYINGLANKQAIVDAYTNTGAGALGNVVIIDGASIPLVSWIYNLKGGLSTMDRLRARALQSLRLLVYMVGAPSKVSGSLAWGTGGWIDQLSTGGFTTTGTFRPKAVPATVSQGIGAAEAPRGALMHICTITQGKISAYQCIVPTTWNASPRDASGVMGPMEQAIAGKASTGAGLNAWVNSALPYGSGGGKMYTQAGAPVTTGGGVEALRVAQSFDPCIACAVH